MKRRVLFVVLFLMIFASVAILSACDGNTAGVQGVDNGKPNQPSGNTEIYDKVNELLAKEYNKVSVVLNTQKEDMSLCSVYEVSKIENGYALVYSMERYNTLTLEADPIQEKSTQTGEIRYIDGQKKVVRGEDIDISIRSITLSRFTLAESYISSVQVKDNTLTANISDGATFLHTSDTIKDCKLSINYNDTSIVQARLTYTDGQGYSVEQVYTVNGK